MNRTMYILYNYVFRCQLQVLELSSEWRRWIISWIILLILKNLIQNYEVRKKKQMLELFEKMTSNSNPGRYPTENFLSR